MLATGGILGGGVVTDYNGRAYEPIFRLPLQPPDLRQEWFQTDFFAPGGHPIHRTGLVVDRSFRPLDSQAEAYYENLYAVGSMLAHSDGIRDGSLEGVALATGYALGERIAGVR